MSSSLTRQDSQQSRVLPCSPDFSPEAPCAARPRWPQPGAEAPAVPPGLRRRAQGRRGCWGGTGGSLCFSFWLPDPPILTDKKSHSRQPADTAAYSLVLLRPGLPSSSWVSSHQWVRQIVSPVLLYLLWCTGDALARGYLWSKHS